MVTDGVACNVLAWCSEDADLGFVVPDVPSAEDLEDSAVDLTVDVSTDGILSKVLGCSEDEDLCLDVPKVPSAEDSVDTVVDLTVDAFTDGVLSKVLGCSEDLGFVVPEVPSVGDSVDTVVDLTVDVTAGENGIFSEREKCPAKQSL